MTQLEEAVVDAADPYIMESLEKEMNKIVGRIRETRNLPPFSELSTVEKHRIISEARTIAHQAIGYVSDRMTVRVFN